MEIEKNTVAATAALVALLDAVAAHDASAIDVSKAYVFKCTKLEHLRSLGFTSVQSGHACRYNEHAIPKKGEFAHFAAVTEFARRFNLAWDLKLTEKQLVERQLNPLAHRPSIDQVKNDSKQQVISLKTWLRTGHFSSNIGKDGAKIEVMATMERANLLSIDNKESKIVAEIDAQQVVEFEKTLLAATNSGATAESLAIITGELDAARTASVASFIASEHAKVAYETAKDANEAAKDALATKKNKAQDMKTLATSLTNKYTKEQLQLLIKYLQNGVV